METPSLFSLPCEGSVLYKNPFPPLGGHITVISLNRNVFNIKSGNFTLMNSIFYRILTREHRDELLKSFFIAFEELQFVLTTKIFSLEANDLNNKHPNFLKTQRKIEKASRIFQETLKNFTVCDFLIQNIFTKLSMMKLNFYIRQIIML